MKKLLVFGGQSPSNLRWQEELKCLLEEGHPDIEVTIHTYDYWINGETRANENEQVNFEISRAKEAYKGRHFDLVIGKSFGAVMALECLQTIKVSRFLLVGPPLMVEDKLIQDILANLSPITVPIIVLANTGDPVANIRDLNKLEKDNKNIKLELFSSSGHEYKPEVVARFVN